MPKEAGSVIVWVPSTMEAGRQGLAQALCQRLGGGHVGGGQQNQKFLATDASQQVAVAQLGTDGPHSFLQGTVAGGVAVGVVDGLEVVQIKHDGGGTGAVALPDGNQLLHLLEGVATAASAGQRVMDDQFIQTVNQCRIAGGLLNIPQHDASQFTGIADLNQQPQQKSDLDESGFRAGV
jgi:hypothetical protein